MRSPKATRGRKKYKKPTKKELAEIKALSNMNLTPHAIEVRTGICHTTVAKYLANQEAYNEPGMDALITTIMEREIQDLAVLTVKARERLHQLAAKMNPIEAIALMDRTFQQRRLLQGKSTENVATLIKIITEANKDLQD